MIALALFGAVVVTTGGALVAWRWWLLHLAQVATQDAGAAREEVKRLREDLELMDRRVKHLEIRAT